MSRISALALLIFTLIATEANAQQVGLQDTQEIQLLKKLGIITSSNSINSSNTGYVDPNSTASGTNSYKTIQSAINAGFSTIEVGPGTYTENLTLKPNILLVGNNTTISGNITYAPTGGNLVDVAYLKNLKITGTISCDYTGKTGNSSYGFLDIRSCQFPTLTCLARAGLGNDGVSVQDFVFDTLPETFDFTCTNGFFDLEHVEVGNLDSEGDAFGSAVVANVSGTTTINSNGGFNFSQGIITGNVTVAASKGTALHLFQTSVKGSTITIGAASTVVGTASRLTGGSTTAGAGTYDPDTNLVAGSGITVTQVANSDQFRITNTSSPGTEGLPAVLAVDPTMSASIVPNADNTVALGSSVKRLSSVNAGQYLLGDGALNLVSLSLDSAGKVSFFNPANLAGSSSTVRVWNNITSQAEVLDLGWAGNVGRVVTTQGGTGVARDLQVGTAGAAGLYFITNNSNRWLIDTAGNLHAVLDNTFDIGAAGALRPHIGWFSAQVRAPLFAAEDGNNTQLAANGGGGIIVATSGAVRWSMPSNGVGSYYLNPTGNVDQFQIGWDGSNNGLLLTEGDTRPLYVGSRGISNLFLRTHDLDRWIVDGSNGIMYPGLDVSYDLGTTSNKIRTVYAGGAVAYALPGNSAIRNTGASTSTTYMDLGVAVFRDSFAGSLANRAVVAVAGNSVVNQNGLVAWAGGTDPTSAITTAFSQDSADVLDLGNGSFGDKSGTLNLAAVNATGTVTVGALTLPRGKPVVTADKVVTPTTVTNTTTETTVYTFSVPGGTLGTTGSMRLTLCGNLSSALVSPGTYTVRVYYGATSFALVNGATLGSGDANAAVRIVVDLSAGNATGAQLINATYDDNSGAVGSVSNFQVRGPASEDSTAAKTFKVTVQFGSASASNTFITEFAHTEVLQ